MCKKVTAHVRIWTDLNEVTIHLSIRLKRFQDSLPISGSYQDAHEVLDIDRLLWDARTPHMCACAWRMRTFAYQSTRLNHTWPHQDKLPLCYGLSWQMDTSKVTLESVHWRKLKDTWCSSLIPTKVWIRGDRKHDILFWDRYQFNLICQICCIIVLQG